MDMSSHSPTSHGAAMPSHTSMNSMSGMSSTFSASTRVTLWFTEWTTTTTATYILTIIFLFCLGLLNRFLAAFKSQLERKWRHQNPSPSHSRHTSRVVDDGDRTVKGHVRRWSRMLSTQPVRLDDAGEQESQPLSPMPESAHVQEKGLDENHNKTQRFWKASAPWHMSRDGVSGILEAVRALIGYILMLAVMTYNIGLFFAVIGSVMIGEMIFGRYTRGTVSIAEDGCHS